MQAHPPAGAEWEQPHPEADEPQVRPRVVYGPRGSHPPHHPDCGLSTDIFSGFHSETEEDHQLSLSLMEECGYDSAFMFKYSERPGTHASKHLPDDVPEEVKIRRLNEIIALQNRLSAEANARCVGKTYEVLVEGVSKRSRDQLFGRTEQNRVVVFDRGTHRVGDFVMVKVTESSSATLKGEEVAG